MCTNIQVSYDKVVKKGAMIAPRGVKQMRRYLLFHCKGPIGGSDGGSTYRGLGDDEMLLLLIEREKLLPMKQGFEKVATIRRVQVHI